MQGAPRASDVWPRAPLCTGRRFTEQLAADPRRASRRRGASAQYAGSSTTGACMGGIKCGNCSRYHESVDEVRKCREARQRGQERGQNRWRSRDRRRPKPKPKLKPKPRRRKAKPPPDRAPKERSTTRMCLYCKKPTPLREIYQPGQGWIPTGNCKHCGKYQ